MKRRAQPTAAELDRAREAASAARVARGLPAIDPGDLEHEQLQAEQRARKKTALTERLFDFVLRLRRGRATVSG